MEVKQTQEFSQWLRELGDKQARLRIRARIERLAFNNLGDVQPVGDNVSELRVHYGPGYRVYFTTQARTLIILLCGGNKKTQNKDINLAKQLRKEWADNDKD